MKLTVPIELALTPRSQALMEALGRTLGTRFQAQESDDTSATAEPVHTCALPPIGTFMPEHGGYFHGVLMIGSQIYGEVTGPKAECEVRDLVWLTEEKDIPGARSGSDSLANTIAMAEAGSPLALAAQACRSGGFSDWAIAGRVSTLLQYENLRPMLTGDEAFDLTKVYRTSTQCSRNGAWLVGFEDGGSTTGDKSWAGGAARFVRRFPLNP